MSGGMDKFLIPLNSQGNSSHGTRSNAVTHVFVFAELVLIHIPFFIWVYIDSFFSQIAQTFLRKDSRKSLSSLLH